jgi:hypothetical protein
MFDLPVAKITTQGLTAIACSVAILWGFVLSERNLMMKATAERAKVMRTIEIERIQRVQPASNPMPTRPHPDRSVLG